MHNSILIFLCSLLIIVGTAFGNNIQSIGVPYVQNYTKSSYVAGNQNWSVTIDENQIMYYGNSQGLLSFNGNAWQLHKTQNNLIVRAVSSDLKGKIYTGAFGEMGFWSYDAKAILRYHSLNHLIPKSNPLNDEIWKIYVDGDRVIFQSFAAIYIYQNGKVKVVDKGPYVFLIKADNRYFVEILKKGLFELKENELEFIKGGEAIGNTEVLSILHFEKDKFIIGTSNQGLFILDKNGVKPWNVSANSFLKTYQLNNGVALFNKYFAFGTILNGIVIIDKQGNIIQKINKSSGLQNNTVLSLFIDKAQNLWAGLDNGIDRIELNSPLSFFFDKTGQFGTVYSSIIYRDKIYLGTNQGLFYSAWDASNKRQLFDFKLISGSQGQVWDLSVIDGELFCGHNNGTFKVSGAAINKISQINGGWTIKKLNLMPNKLIQGTYNGLVIYSKLNNGSYQFSHQIKGFSAPSRYVEQDARGNIWISHAYKGLFKINLNDDLKSIKGPVKSYDQSSGLPSDYGINIFNLDGRIIFSSDSGFYVYDDISDKFKKYDELNKSLGGFKTANKVIQADAKKYWFIEHGKVSLVDFTKPGRVEVNANLFSVLNGRMVQDYENISKINNQLYLISVDDGFVLFDQKLLVTKQNIPKVFIGRVDNITGNSFIITESGSLNEAVSIKYSQNSLRINYGLPFYRQAKIVYKYYLKGYSKGWSSWITNSQKDFTNLPYGEYEFQVRAKVNDNEISEISTFNFEIYPPFYATFWAYLIYFILFLIGVFVVRKWYFFKLNKHQMSIQAQLKKERDEHLK